MKDYRDLCFISQFPEFCSMLHPCGGLSAGPRYPYPHPGTCTCFLTRPEGLAEVMQLGSGDGVMSLDTCVGPGGNHNYPHQTGPRQIQSRAGDHVAPEADLGEKWPGVSRGWKKPEMNFPLEPHLHLEFGLLPSRNVRE